MPMVPAPRPAADADPGHDAPTASGHQAAAVLQYRGRVLRRAGARAESAAGARRGPRRAAAGTGRAGPGAASGGRPVLDTAEVARGDSLPTEVGGAAGCGLLRQLRRRRPCRRRGELFPHAAGAAAAISKRDDRSIDDLADERPPLRDYLGEQLRLSFADPVDRMIGAHLIALLCPAGRLTAEPAAIAERDEPAAGAGRGGARPHDAVRSGRPVRARPGGMPGGPAAGQEPARPGDAGAARQSGAAGAARDAQAAGAVRRGFRGPRRHDRRDPRARSRSRRQLQRRPGARGGARPADAAAARRAAGSSSSTRRPCRACW